MIRVLFISRYRDPTMDRKVELIAQHADLSVCQIRPSRWQDDLLTVDQSSLDSLGWRQIAVPLLGQSDDPHRALYQTLFFGMHRFHPHVVHVEEEPDSLAALQVVLARAVCAPKARLVIHTWQNINRRKKWYVRWVLKTVLRSADYMVCANQEAVGVLREQGYDRPATVLPAIGVDTDVFHPDNGREKAENAFVLGYIGRLVPEKGIDLLIEALAVLDSRTKLRVIGAGPYRAALVDKAEQLGVAPRVEFVAPCPPTQVAQEMRQLDALVLASRTTPVWKEQLGRVLIEAMACGVPVVGSTSGAIPEVIGDAGLVLAENDVGVLVECVRRLSDSPTLSATLVEKGYTRATQVYSQRSIARRTVDLYRQLVG